MEAEATGLTTETEATWGGPEGRPPTNRRPGDHLNEQVRCENRPPLSSPRFAPFGGRVSPRIGGWPCFPLAPPARGGSGFRPAPLYATKTQTIKLTNSNIAPTWAGVIVSRWWRSKPGLAFAHRARRCPEQAPTTDHAPETSVLRFSPAWTSARHQIGTELRLADSSQQQDRFYVPKGRLT